MSHVSFREGSHHPNRSKKRWTFLPFCHPDSWCFAIPKFGNINFPWPEMEYSTDRHGTCPRKNEIPMGNHHFLIQKFVFGGVLPSRYQLANQVERLLNDDFREKKLPENHLISPSVMVSKGGNSTSPTEVSISVDMNHPLMNHPNVLSWTDIIVWKIQLCLHLDLLTSRHDVWSWVMIVAYRTKSEHNNWPQLSLLMFDLYHTKMMQVQSQNTEFHLA